MSILKPNKPRQPLQAVNLGDEDEEEDTTEVRRRRVSFANIKIKEFNSDAETVVICDTPAYEEDFTASSDSSQIVKNLSHPLLVKQTPEKEVYGYCDMDISNIEGGNIQSFNINSQRSSLAPIDDIYNVRHHGYSADIRPLQGDNVNILEDSMDITGMVSPKNFVKISQQNTSINNMNMDSSLAPKISFRTSVGNIQHTSFGQETFYGSMSGFNSDMNMVNECVNKENFLNGRQTLGHTLPHIEKSLSILHMNSSSTPFNSSSVNGQVFKNIGERRSVVPETLQHPLVTNISQSHFTQSPSHKRYRLSQLPDSQMDISNELPIETYISSYPNSSKKISFKDSADNMCLTQPISYIKNSMSSRSICDSSLPESVLQTNRPEHQAVSLSSQDNFHQEVKYHSSVSVCQFDEVKKLLSEGCPESDNVSMTCESPVALLAVSEHPCYQDPIVICHNDSECLNETVDLSNLVAEQINLNFNNQEKECDTGDNQKNDGDILETTCNISTNILINNVSKNDSKRKLEEMREDEVSEPYFQSRVDQVFCDKSMIVRRFSQATTNASFNKSENLEVPRVPPSDLESSFQHSLHSFKRTSVFSELEPCHVETEAVEESSIKQPSCEPVADYGSDKNKEQLGLKAEANVSAEKINISPQKILATTVTENSKGNVQINHSQGLIVKELTVTDMDECSLLSSSLIGNFVLKTEVVPVSNEIKNHAAFTEDFFMKQPSCEPASDKTKEQVDLPRELSKLEVEANVSAEKINISPQKILATSSTELSIGNDQINHSQSLIVKEMTVADTDECSLLSSSLIDNFVLKAEVVPVSNEIKNHAAVTEDTFMKQPSCEPASDKVCDKTKGQLDLPRELSKLEVEANVSAEKINTSPQKILATSFTENSIGSYQINHSQSLIVKEMTVADMDECSLLSSSLINNFVLKTEVVPVSNETKNHAAVTELSIKLEVPHKQIDESINGQISVCMEIEELSRNPLIEEMTSPLIEELETEEVDPDAKQNQETESIPSVVEETCTSSLQPSFVNIEDKCSANNYAPCDLIPDQSCIQNSSSDTPNNNDDQNCLSDKTDLIVETAEEPVMTNISLRDEKHLIGVVNESVVNISLATDIANENQMEVLESTSMDVSTKTSLSDVTIAGHVFSPLQLHNKHYMENLGYHFCEWTKWTKHFFHGAVVLHVIIPWVEFDQQTPVESVALELSELEKSKALSFFSSAVVKKINNLDILKDFKTLQDTNRIINEISSIVEHTTFYYLSFEELLSKKANADLLDGRLVFYLANLKTVRAADVYINLENWDSLSRNDVSIMCHVGKVNLSAVKSLFFSIPPCKERFYEFARALEHLLES